MTVLLTFVVCLVVLGALGLALVASDPWLNVAQTLVVRGTTVAQLEPPVHLLLANTWGSEVFRGAPGALVLVLRRRPGWVWIPLVLTFPVGLLFLLYRETRTLQVLLTQDGPDTQVRIDGRSKKSVITTLAKALGSLEAVVSHP